MAFLPYSKGDGTKVPWEYLAAGDITPKIGLTLYLSSGLLELATGTTKPEYICMCAGDQLTEGDVIPVIKVEDDMIFETTNQTAFTSINVGDKVTIHTDAAQVTATTTNGVAEVVSIGGTAASSEILVRF